MNLKKIKGFFTLGLIATISLMLPACGAATEPPVAPPDELPANETPADQVAANGQFIPGAHYATVLGGWDMITVRLETNETEILSVDIIHNDTEAFVGPAITALEVAILESQNPNYVDTVSSATITSAAVLEATSLAFLIAQGDPEPVLPTFIAGRYTGLIRPDVGGIGEGATRVWLTFDDEYITEVEVYYHMETGEEFNEEEVNAALVAAVLEAQGPVTGIFEIEGAPDATTNLTNAVMDAISHALRQPQFVVAEGEMLGDGDFTMGVYVTEVQGRNAPITLALGVTDSSVMRVLIAHRDTPMFAEHVLNTLAQNIITYQTYDVDVLSGATTSTNAVIAGFEELFSQATASE